MVGPSNTEAERRDANAQLKAGFVLLVGVSGGLVALQGDATSTQLLAAVAAALVVGVLLVAFLSRVGREFRRT